MTATFDNFKTEWLGKRVADPLLAKLIPPIPPERSYQCVSLIKQYLQDCFGIAAGFWGDAIDYWTKTNPALLMRFTRIETTNVLKGDIVILRGVASPEGHIVLATGNSNTIQFEALEQDGATGSGDGLNGNAIRTRWIAKSRIAGVLRMKVTPPVTVLQPKPPRPVLLVKPLAPDLPAKAYALPFKPVTAPSGKTYFIVKDIPGYYTSGLAASRQKSNSTVHRGSYHIYREYNGMMNITVIPGQPGWWINPADNKVGAPPKHPPLDTAVQARADAMAVHAEPTLPAAVDPVFSTQTTLEERQALKTMTLRDKVVVGYDRFAKLLKL